MNLLFDPLIIWLVLGGCIAANPGCDTATRLVEWSGKEGVEGLPRRIQQLM